MVKEILEIKLQVSERSNKYTNDTVRLVKGAVLPSTGRKQQLPLAWQHVCASTTNFTVAYRND